MEQLKIFSGTSNRALAEAICQYLNIELGQVEISRFKSGEIYVHYMESIRNSDIFIVHSLSHPVNENLVELLVMIDAAKRASAKTVHLLIPYFGYARQSRKKTPRQPISAKLIADVLTEVGAQRMVTVDLNSDAIEGFFHIPVDHLTALDLMIQHIESLSIENPIVVSPDAGRAKMAERLASKLNAPFAMLIKKQSSPLEPKTFRLVGDVAGFTPIIVDDIIDSGATVLNVADKLHQHGANPSYVCASHGLFSGDCIKKLNNNPHIRQIAVTDTIHHHLEDNPKFKILSMAEIFGTAIQIITTGGSIDKLVNRK